MVCEHHVASWTLVNLLIKLKADCTLSAFDFSLLVDVGVFLWRENPVPPFWIMRDVEERGER